MLKPKDYDKMLQFITAISPEACDFRRTVLQQLQGMYGYNYSTFFVADSKGALRDPIARNISEYFNEIYTQYYYKVDMFNSRNISRSLLQKKVVSVTDIMSYDQFIGTEYYNDFIRKINLRHEVVLPLMAEDTLLGAIGVFRSGDEGAFTPRDLMILNRINELIAHHLKTSQTIGRIQGEQQLFRCCSQQSPVGILVLNQDFSLLYGNEHASRLCADISTAKSADGAVSDVLNALIGKITDREFNSGITLRSCQAKILPQLIPNIAGSFETVYIIYIAAVSPPDELTFEKIAGTFGLSDREKEILALVCHGLGNREIAEKLYLSIHTVKSHIESIFRKTGVNRRTALLTAVNKFGSAL